MSGLRRFVSAAICMLLPTALKPMLLNLMGHHIHRRARIGLSIILADRMYMDHGARIGPLNLIRVRRLVMRSQSVIGRMNIINGPLSIQLRHSGAIGNSNTIARARLGVTSGPSRLKIGKIGKITANHKVDCTKSICLGDYTTIAGSGSQLWTHGYIHDQSGPGRYRIDGPIVIGDNVYIGSACIVSMGISIANGAIVGGGTSVSKSLTEAGLYVSSAIRQLPRPLDAKDREDLIAVKDPALCEPVFMKKSSPR